MTAAPKHSLLLFLSLLAILGLVGTGTPADADENKSPTAETGDYWDESGHKFARGFQNTALGWVELPQGIQNIGEEHGFGAAATWGVVHGTGRAIQRTAVGIFEIFTFPWVNDNRPLIEPEFVIAEPQTKKESPSPKTAPQ